MNNLALQDQEEWRAVVGYEGKYEVSSWGRVRSLPRMTLRNGRPFGVKGGLLNCAVTTRGYPRVGLYDSTSPNGKIFLIHRLVCTAFYGPPFEGAFAAHIDGNKGNCRADNLRWASPKENSHDWLLHRNLPPGSPERRRLVIEGTAPRIQELKAKIYARIARHFGLPAEGAEEIIDRLWMIQPDELTRKRSKRARWYREGIK
jgi:hypothetical protein